MAATEAGFADAAVAWGEAFAAGLTPPPEVTISEWAEGHRGLAQESSPYPGPWRTARAPYLKEPMDCLSPSHPCRRVSVKKGAQLGFTDVGINLIGATAELFGGPCMLVAPTVDIAKAYNREKLEPAIRATPSLRRRIRTQRSRSSDGSTALFKRFPAGHLIVTGANSSAGLQMRSVKVLIKEELSEWPYDVDNRGDPDDLAEQRTDAYSDECKIYEPSTPSVEGNCRITKRFEDSDQRRYHVPCPECGEEQVLAWERLRWSRAYPHEATYECAGCGVLIGHGHKREMLAKGRWVAEKPGPGREPGFHLSQLYSPFVSWDSVVDKWLKAEGDPRKEKVFTQQVLGEAWKDQGDAPEAEALWKRREEYRLGTVPPGGLVLTLGVDLGKDHFIYEVVAWGIGKTSWSVDFGKISVGDTASLESWAAVKDLMARRYPDWRGAPREIEMTAIDSGYNTHAVYSFTRGRTRCIAVKGFEGDNAPALGTARKVDVNYEGKTIKKGVRFFPVGTWTLKSEFYANLRKAAPEDGEERFPIGYCHFSKDHGLEFFEEATNEHLTTYEDKRSGREVRRWKRLGPNHFLDARVYAMAAAERMGISRLTFDGWQRLAAEREAPPEGAQRDLEALWASVAPAGAPAKPPAASESTTGERRSRRRARQKRYWEK